VRLPCVQQSREEMEVLFTLLAERYVSVHRDHSLAVRLEQIGVLLDDAVFGRLCLGVL
jgi:hypothetical protein